jgi:outer membrane protein TolC
LLKGFGTGVNLADLRQARLDTAISEYEFTAFAMTLVAEVEKSCWDYELAGAQVDIVHESLRLAEQQLNETRERIRIGKIAAVERAAAEAEVALRREAVINAESDITTARLRLLRLLNTPASNLWNRALEIRIPRNLPAPSPDAPEDHVQLALTLRPDLNEARLALQRNELEVVKTRNGLLPKLDFFITLGQTGYADSFPESVGSDNGHDLTVGLLAQYPLGARSERVAHRRAMLSREQAGYAVENLSQLVQVDVRTAYVEMRRAEEQVAATRATRRLQEENLRAETEKYRIGKSTSLLVARAQRDYVQSQINEAQAMVNSFKNAVDLYRLDGSLLERRGLNVLCEDRK